MKPIVITDEQISRLKEMYFEFGGAWKTATDLWFKTHWLPICLYWLLPEVAKAHGKQLYTTPDWSKHLVKQRVIDSIPDTNPIDTLYDIWKHPEKYAQSL